MSAITTEKPLALLSPLMTKEMFSYHSGLRPGQIKSQAEHKNLPMFKVGRLNLVNLAALGWDDYQLIPSPALTATKFADASGLRVDQVETQLSLNSDGTSHLPRTKIGRLVLVDVGELYRRCLAKAPQLVD
jgi:hypothetical protein